MLLADVFETFRRTIKKQYNLDPAHFITAPGLSWIAGLRLTRVQLELLRYPDMLIFVDMAMMGGVSAVLQPHARASHAECGEEYNSNLPFNWILYVDANNLYGWAMLQYLPTRGFEWVDMTERENWAEFILQPEDESPVGYMLEVDLEYPDE